MSARLRSTVVAAALAVALAVAPVLGSAGAPALAAPAQVTVARAAAATAAAGSPVSFTLLVPLTVRPTTTGLIDATTLAAYTAPLGVLTRQLDAVINTPAVIGIDPMIIASIRVLGTSAPASALDWLARLQSADNETFALAYDDADLATLARADALSLRAPIGFDFALDAGHFGPAVTATPTASATPTPTASATPPPTGGTPPLPTSVDQVLQWTYTLPSIAWPADDTVVGADISDLSSAGYKQVVLTSTNVSASDSGLVDLTGMQGIVADSGVTSLVREAVYAAGDGTRQDSLTRLNTALAGMEAVSPGRTVVATLDRQWPLGALNIDALYSDLAGQAGVITAGLTSVLGGDHPDATITDAPTDTARTDSLHEVLASVAADDSFSTVADTPNLVREPRRLALLSLMAVSWLRGTDDWDAAVQSYLTDSTTLRASVKIVSGSDLFVGAGSTNIPVTVSNALPYPVTVYVNVISPRSILQVLKQNVALKIEPGSSNKAAIPVQALTNGDVTTAVTITSNSGVQIDTPDYVKVDLQPAWEGIGTTIVVILLVLVFGGGIARNIVKRRRARREAAGTGTGTGDADADSAAADTTRSDTETADAT